MVATKDQRPGAALEWRHPGADEQGVEQQARANRAAGLVTYTWSPVGDAESSTISRTALIDSVPTVLLPCLPATLSGRRR